MKKEDTDNLYSKEDIIKIVTEWYLDIVDSYFYTGLDQGSVIISENTKKYSLTISETKMFLLNDILLRYYKKALSLLKKYHYTLDSLKLYFSDIDYRKFISHIKLFHRVINELLYTLGDENNKLVRSLKSVEKNIDYFYRVVNKL